MSLSLILYSCCNVRAYRMATPLPHRNIFNWIKEEAYSICPSCKTFNNNIVISFTKDSLSIFMVEIILSCGSRIFLACVQPSTKAPRRAVETKAVCHCLINVFVYAYFQALYCRKLSKSKWFGDSPFHEVCPVHWLCTAVHRRKDGQVNPLK